ncbi:hypothetical protein C6P92_11720 [Burkholderia multivorans]|nr:hypothetical protein C6P92_11720 [Burkholderia multivorans]
MSRRLTYRSSYQPMLAWLEEQLNEPMEMGKTKGAWIETDPDGKKWALKPVLKTTAVKRSSSPSRWADWSRAWRSQSTEPQI